MKDIERIQSTELAVQVQDANPGNFAIEQEVAQLVGATVPAPTAPSADDARELGAQLLVFLRRALTPIQTALRTAVAAIYAHLDSRCTDYTPAAYAPFRLPAGPYDPMRPFVPRTLPNLLTAITAFDSRKISNGSAPNDGIPDGTSLARLLGGDYASVTKLIDETEGWTLSKNFPNAFPNLLEIDFGCKTISAPQSGLSSVTKLRFRNVKRIEFNPSNYQALISGMPNLTVLEFPDLEYADMKGLGYLFGSCPSLLTLRLPKIKTISACNEGSFSSTTIKTIEMPVLETVLHYNWGGFPGGLSALERLQLGKTYMNGRTGTGADLASCSALIDLEFAEGLATNTNLSGWNPTDKGTTFLQNFKEHIALRLTSNGSGKTLTLSQAVFSAVIEGSSPICDDIKGIIEDKGWKVQDTNNNIFPTT